MSVTLHMNYGPATHEIRRESAGEKWCFHCRKRLLHDFVVRAPIEPSYYGPHWFYACSGCGLDRVTFPGGEVVRDWADGG